MAVVLGSLIIFYLIIFEVYKYLSQRKRGVMAEKADTDRKIIKEIQSNNRYNLILDVFTTLDKNAEKNGLELHTNLKGYLEYGKTE